MRCTTSVLFATVSTLTYHIGIVHAFWRLPCQAQSGLARMDPIVNLGQPSDHVHAIFGSGSFGLDSTPKDLLNSNCTSCAVTQDKSAYWTPALYFVESNGQAELVQNVGGMLAYYLLYGENVKAFPDGFKMIAGDTRQRNFSWPVPDPPKSEWSGSEVSQPALAQKALGFNCLNYAIAPEGSLYRHFLPDKAYLDGHCTDGIRMEIMFPSCWNGKDLDSPDHKSHVAYPTLVNGGTCPKGYETKLVSLFYETIWNTYAFKGRDGQFAIANGDPTGFGYHGDFMAAWDGDTLERAVKQCTNPSGKVEDCPIFDLQSQSEAQTCKISMPTELKDENYQGPREGLPGKVGIQAGPAYALKKSSGDSSNQSGGASSQSSSVASSSVPTLSYSSAAPASSIGGSYGGAVGGLFAEVVSTSSSTTSSSPSPPSSAPPPSTTPSSSSTSPAAVAPTTTSPPSLQAAGQLSTISTTYLTKGQLAYEIVVVEEDVTVTATSTVAAGKHRRHLHRHQHHHGRK